VAIVMWACAVTRQRPSQELADRLLARYIPLFRKRLVRACNVLPFGEAPWPQRGMFSGSLCLPACQPS
jgi:hypothetical protein